MKSTVSWGYSRKQKLFHVIGAGSIGGTLCDSLLEVVRCVGMPKFEECCEICLEKVTRWAGAVDDAGGLNVPEPGQASTMFRVDLREAPERVRTRRRVGLLRR